MKYFLIVWCDRCGKSFNTEGEDPTVSGSRVDGPRQVAKSKFGFDCFQTINKEDKNSKYYYLCPDCRKEHKAIIGEGHRLADEFLAGKTQGVKA